MKILHLISAPAAGGAEIYVKDLAKALVEEGDRVHIGFLNHAADVGRSREFETEFLEELSSCDIPYFFLPAGTRSRLWPGMKHVQQYVAQESIDVFHSHLTYGIICGALARVPRFYTHHNIRMRVPRPVFRLLDTLVDGYVAISGKCHDALRPQTSKSIETIFNGIDASRIGANQGVVRRFSLPLSCVAIGHVCAQKNYGLMIEALSRLDRNAKEKMRLQIVGDGAEREVEDLRRAISSSGLNDYVQLLGHRSDVPDILSNSQLLLMSSAYEGLPIVLIEAVTSGVPAIVTDVGGCVEIVGNGECGIVIPPDDPNAFSRALNYVLDNPECIEKWSENALTVSGGFAISTSSTAHSQMYRRVLEKKNGH